MILHDLKCYVIWIGSYDLHNGLKIKILWATARKSGVEHLHFNKEKRYLHFIIYKIVLNGNVLLFVFVYIRMTIIICWATPTESFKLVDNRYEWWP